MTKYALMDLAPVCLFVYNRLEHARQTIEALQKNELAKESLLFVFSDGPKNQEDILKVAEIRQYLKTLSGFKEIIIIENTKNSGLANSIIYGVTEIVNKYSKIIVLEDDMVSSPFFLEYMNEALTLYENETAVISIHAYIYPIKKKLPETFFIKGADCWGWATWQRGWKLFEPDGLKLLKEINENSLNKEFNFNNSFNYDKMLEKQTKGENNSWAIRWYASAFLKNKLTLYPGHSLINNIGVDGSGTHCKNIDKRFENVISDKKIILSKLPLVENKVAKKKIEKYFKSFKIPISERIKNKIWPKNLKKL